MTQMSICMFDIIMTFRICIHICIQHVIKESKDYIELVSVPFMFYIMLLQLGAHLLNWHPHSISLIVSKSEK